jgi:2-keto-4-pentenoate hydratase
MEGLTQKQIRKEAQELYRAEREKTVLRPFTEKYPKIEPAESYRIQLALIEMKKADGAKVVGKKIGLTSKAMQKMLNVDQPDYGHILDGMVLQDGVVFPYRRADSTEDRLHSRPRDQRTGSHAHSGLGGDALRCAGVGNHR